MNAEKKPLTTGKIFGKVAKEMGLQGRGVTRYREYPTYYLLVNHQKSSYSKRFYINVVIVYKELLERLPNEEELQNAFRTNKTVPWHVNARIEDFMPKHEGKELIEMLDACVDDEKLDELGDILKDGLRKVFAFLEKNHDRKTIRRLNDEKKFFAIIRKEV